MRHHPERCSCHGSAAPQAVSPRPLSQEERARLWNLAQLEARTAAELRRAERLIFGDSAHRT